MPEIELYDVLARSEVGTRWEVGAGKKGSLIIGVGSQVLILKDVQRDVFAEAVARAVMPGQPERTAEAHAAQAGDGGG